MCVFHCSENSRKRVILLLLIIILNSFMCFIGAAASPNVCIVCYYKKEKMDGWMDGVGFKKKKKK